MPTPLQLAQENLQKIQNEIFVLKQYVTELQTPNKNKQEQESSIRTTLRQTYPQEFEVSKSTNLLPQILLRIQTLESNKNFLTTKVSQEQQKETAQLKIEQATQENLKRIKELSTEINLALKEKRMQDAVKLSDERRNIKKQVRIADIQEKTISPKKAAIIPSMNNEAVTSDEKEMQLTSKTEVELEQMKCVNVLLVTGKMKTSGDEDLLSELGIANPTEFLQKTQEATVAAEKGSAERIPVRFLPKWCVNELSNVSQNASSEELEHRLSSEAFRKLAILAKRSFEIDQIKKVTSDVGEKYSSGQIEESKDMWNNIEYNTVQAVLEDSSLLNNPAILNERVVQLMLQDSQVSDEWKQNYQIDKKGTPTTAIAHFSEEIQRVKRDTENKIAKGIKGKELWNDSKEVYQPFIQKLDLDIRYPTRSTETILAEREAMFKAIAQGTLLPKGAALPVRIDNRENLVNEATFALKHTINGSLDYDAAIRSLDRARDAARGIDSKWIAADKANGQPMAIYLSDARNAVSADKEQDTFENWASMGLSYFRIAEKMIEIEISKLEKRFPGDGNEAIRAQLITTLQSTRSVVQKGAQAFLTGIQQEMAGRERDDARQTAKHYMFDTVTNTLAPFLANILAKTRNTDKPGQLPEEDKETSKARLKNFRNEMAVLRDFGSLEREPFSQVTINNALGYTAESGIYTTRMDVPLYDLTSAQKDEFNKIARQNELYQGETLPEWYSEQPEVVRDMIAAYAKDILAGRDLPSQMYQYIPALRNAAEIRCYSNTLGEQKEYFRDYRSGNIGSDIRSGLETKKGYVFGKYKAPAIQSAEAVQKATQESIEQFQHLTGADTVVLNSLIDITSFREVNDRNKAAVNDVNSVNPDNPHVIYGNMAVNKERYTQGVLTAARDMTAADEICRIMEEVISNFRQKDNPAADRIIIQLAWVREEYDQLLANISIVDFRDTENANAHLTAKIEQMTSLIRQYYQVTEDKTGLANIASTSFCKSGKDRAGIVQIIAQSEMDAKNAILDHLILSETKKELETDLFNKFKLATETLFNRQNSAADLINFYERLIETSTEQLRENNVYLDKDTIKLTPSKQDLVSMTDTKARATKEQEIQDLQEAIKTREANIQEINPILKSLQQKKTRLQDLITEADQIKQNLTDIHNEISQLNERNQAPFFLTIEETARLDELTQAITDTETDLNNLQEEIDQVVAADFAENTALIWKEIASELGYKTDEVNWDAVFRANGTSPSDNADILMHLANAVSNPKEAPLNEESKIKLNQCLNNIALKKISTNSKEVTILSKIVGDIKRSSTKTPLIVEQVCPKDIDRQRYAHFIQQSAANQISGGHNGRIAANQSVGSEGIKNDGDIIPPSLVAGGATLIQQVTRETADYNNKLLKPKEIDKARLKKRFNLEGIAPIENFQTNSQDKPAPKQNFIMRFLKAAYVAIANIVNNMIGGNKNNYIGSIDDLTVHNDKNQHGTDDDYVEEGIRLSQRETLVAHHSGTNDPFQSLNAHNTKQEIEINKMSTPELLIERDKLVLEHHITLLKFKRSQKKEQHTATDNVAETTYLNDLIVKDMRLKAVHEELGKREHDRTAILAHTKPSINADTQDTSTQFQNKLLHEILHEDALHPKHGENAEKTARKITADADRMSMTSEPRHSIGA